MICEHPVPSGAGADALPCWWRLLSQPQPEASPLSAVTAGTLCFFFLGILFLFCISEKCFPYARLNLGLWGRK